MVDKVAAALRECEEAICNCDALEKAAHGHLPRCAERLRVLARYGEACREAGREECGAWKMVDERIAAARLAGRLEQMDHWINLAAAWGALSRETMLEEQARLRKEAGRG